MNESHFQRLKDNPQLGEYLRALDERPLSGAQLSHNAAQIKTQLAAGVSSTTALTTETILKVGLPLLIAAGVVGAYLGFSQPAGQPQQTASAVSQYTQPAEPNEPEVPVFIPDPSKPMKATVDEFHRPTKLSPVSPQKRDKDTKASPSILPRQLALYENARVSAARGKHEQAVKLLDHLLNEYPTTPLKAEAELTRLEYLTLQGAYGKAIPELNRLLSKPEHAGRSGELLRLLGDLHRKSGNCVGARDAYRKASSKRLNTEEQAAVSEGLGLCPGD